MSNKNESLIKSQLKPDIYVLVFIKAFDFCLRVNLGTQKLHFISRISTAEIRCPNEGKKNSEIE